MISLIIPFIDNWEFTEVCLNRAMDNAINPFEIVLIDNGSDKSYKKTVSDMLKKGVTLVYARNDNNLGVVESFNIGLEKASGELLCFIHNDVLLQENGWDTKIQSAFDNDNQLGLAGLFGGDSVTPDGGRGNSRSNMLGLEWGKCDCHTVAGLHHGAQNTGVSSAIVLDGVGLFFTRECLQRIQKETTALDTTIRAPHHWYDRNLTLHAAELGYHVAVIGVGFDHWSGATANSSMKYHQSAMEWISDHPEWAEKWADKTMDEKIYWTGENQFREDWLGKLPAKVDGDYNVTWGARWNML